MPFVIESKLMKFIADLHIHSPYSRSTSPQMTFENLYQWAQLKGITLLGTGDFTHPSWLSEIQEKLEPAEEGLFKLKQGYRNVEGVPDSCRSRVRFMLSAEISCIYSRDEKTRKVHNVLLAKDLESAGKINDALSAIGKLTSDGRPILGLDSRDLLQITLDASGENILIPAHAWTPHFSVLGAFSSFSSIEECYGDLSSEILAIETGLSSDPPMNWRLSRLDRFTLVSNSDAHSPAKLMREANIFDTDLSYPAVREALRADRNQRTFQGTIEFFPEEGKYHYDGHRACGLRTTPEETREYNGMCPECGRKIVVGVLHRVENLADRPAKIKRLHAKPYTCLIPLQEILSEIMAVGVGSKKVQNEYLRILSILGNEFTVLTLVSIAEIEHAVHSKLAEAVRRVRDGAVHIAPGYDGEYGKTRIFEPGERAIASGQMGLFL